MQERTMAVSVGIPTPFDTGTINLVNILVRSLNKDVELNTLVNAINLSRQMKNPNAGVVTVKDIVKSTHFIEMVIATEIRLGLRNPLDRSYTVALDDVGHSRGRAPSAFKSPLVRSMRGGRGIGGQTWVHPYIAFDIAAHYDKDIAVLFIELTTNYPLRQIMRVDGDLYPELTKDIAQRYLNFPGSPITKISLVAAIIAARCNVQIRTDNTTWDHAGVDQQRVRFELMDHAMVSILRYRDYWDFLDDLAECPVASMRDLTPVDVATVATNFALTYPI